MNRKRRTIIGILAMIIVLAVSAGCLFGCEKSDDDENERGRSKKQTQKTDEDEDDDDDEKSDKKPSKKSKKDDDEDEDDDDDEGDGYEAVVNKYMEAYQELDAEKVVDLMPKKYIKAVAKVVYDDAQETMVDYKQDEFDKIGDDAKENGYKWSEFTYEIDAVEDMDEDEIKDLIGEIDDEYDVELKIKEAKTVKVSMTIPLEGDEIDDDSESLTLVKIGNSWYVIIEEWNFVIEE